MRRTMWTLLGGAMLTMAVAVAGAQGGGACNRECLIGLTEAYLSAMVARDPAKAPVTASVRFTQNTRPISLGQGVWESIKGVRGYKLFVTDPGAGQVALYTVVDIANRYFETLERNIVDHVPFTTNCLRVENGVTTAGRAGAPGSPDSDAART